VIDLTLRDDMKRKRDQHIARALVIKVLYPIACAQDRERHLVMAAHFDAKIKQLEARK